MTGQGGARFDPQVNSRGDGSYELWCEFIRGSNEAVFTTLTITGCDVAPAERSIETVGDEDIMGIYWNLKPSGDFVKNKIPIQLLVHPEGSSQPDDEVLAIFRPRKPMDMVTITLSNGLFSRRSSRRFLDKLD